MSSISNFTQAMRELTGFDEEPGKGKDKAKHAVSEPAAVPKPEMKESFQMPERKEQPKSRLDISMPAFNENAGTLITKTMVISGNVEGTDQMKVDGCISGDLRTASSAAVTGKIIGTVHTDSLAVSGSIKGNVRVGADVRVDSAAVMVGDLQAGNLSIRGKIKGNLQVKDVTDIAETAVIVGDISTGELHSDRGCVISGTISTRDTRAFNFDEEKLFSIGE